MTSKEKSAQVQYTCNHRGPNYIAHVSSNVTFFPHIFDMQIVASVDGEPLAMKGQQLLRAASHGESQGNKAPLCPVL